MLESILRQQPADGHSMFVDMNSYFASVEQQVKPELRGQSVGVCPFLSSKTCVLAASIEAKRHGVKTGMRVTDAKRLCPDIILVEANPRLYRQYHRQIMAELDNTHCRVFAKSIDEAFLEVPTYLRDQTHQIASEIKRRVNSVGDWFRCSVGIGSNLFLAKMGTNLMKPDGLVDIRLQDLPQFYAELPGLTALHGISWRMESRLRQLGILTPLDFFQTPYGLLKQSFGVNGEAWYLRLRGFEVDTKPTHRRIIGHQLTITPEPATSRNQVLAVASQLTYRAAIRLRQANLAARGVVVGIRFVDHSWWHTVYHGKQAFVDSVTFYNHAKRLLAKCRMQQPVRFVSVSAIDLIDETCISPPLFENRSREERLSQALDELNFRYGEQTVMTGRQALMPKPRDAIGYGNATQNVTELPV